MPRLPHGQRDCGAQAAPRLENGCAHRGGPLGEGHVEGTEVTCPWHAWSFDLKTGECTTDPEMKQKTWPVKVEGGEVYLDA